MACVKEPAGASLATTPNFMIVGNKKLGLAGQTIETKVCIYTICVSNARTYVHIM